MHQNEYLAVLKGSRKWRGVAQSWTLASRFFVCFSVPQVLAKPWDCLKIIPSVPLSNYQCI